MSKIDARYAYCDTLKNDDTMRHRKPIHIVMKHLKPIRIVGLTLEPVVFDDGTLLFLHRRTDATLTGIAVIPAEDIYKYALRGNMKYAAKTIPFDEDIDSALQKAFPEKRTHTNIIFGERAARAYGNKELFGGDEDGGENGNAGHTAKEYKDSVDNLDGEFIRHAWRTEAEADAYMLGIHEMNGWQDYIAVDDKDIKKEDEA